jgi:type IV secretory pathway VirB3-like protein
MEVMTMVGHRSRATRPAMALWLFVLVTDTAAAGSLTMMAYVLATVVVLAIVLAEVWAVTRRDQLKPQPVRIRASDHRHGRRPGRR